MKAIDFMILDNTLIRIFLGRDDLRNWWGDDWNDVPYECNAGEVYDEFVAGHIDVRSPRESIVLEPCNGYINSPWCKDDMKDGTIPMFAVLPHVPDGMERWEVTDDFMRLMGHLTSEVWLCYMGEQFDEGHLPDSAILEDRFMKDDESYIEGNRKMALLHLTHTAHMRDDQVDYMDRLAYALFWVKDITELADDDDDSEAPALLTERIIELTDRNGNEDTIERLRRIGKCEPQEYISKLSDALGCELDYDYPIHDTNAITERLVRLIGR